MLINIKSNKFRWIIGIGVPIVGILLGIYLYKFGSPIPCFFRKWTGIHCFGCGSGRAAYDILHFRFLEAMGHNILFVFALPFVMYYLLKMYLSVCLGKDVLPFFTFSSRHIEWMIIVLFAFLILRNIPIVPFNWLAQ